MRREEIIAKGAYTAPQFGELVSVKQFIMLRQKGAKNLYLRLHNDRADRADAVCFKVKQYDVKGTLIATETVTRRNLAIGGGEDATLEGPVKLHRSCIDFTVEMVYAEYGNYTYRLHGGVLSASYENRSDETPVDKKHISKQMHGESSRVSARTLSTPKLLVASMALILLIVGLFAAIQLKNFMATEEFFTLGSVDYKFLTPNHENGPISIEGYNGKAGNIIIPVSIEGHPVAAIADGAFEGRKLKSVTIKGSPSIGQRAFASCHLLTTVTMPEVTALGAGAFSDCRSLKNVTLGNGLTHIPASTFAGCRSLVEIPLPAELVSLGDAAFAGCTNLAGITLPDTLADVGEGVFTNCTSLTSLTSPYAGLDQAGKNNVGYFFGGSDQIPDSLKSIVITRATSIGDNAFFGCEGAVSIELPKTVTTIGTNAFGGCGKLTNLTIPNAVTSIGNGAFRSCASLAEVVIPEGVKVIPQSAFSGCSGLKSITLPAALETIEQSAFMDCSSLARLDVPASVTTIKANALNGCTSLEALTLPFVGETSEKALPLNSLFGETTHALKSLTVRNAKSIPDYAFAEFDALTTVSLYGTAERIGEYAFENCASLQSILLPEATSEIGAHAFAGCSSLASIQLPAQLSVISEGTFENCTSLHAITVPNTVQTVEAYAFWGCSSLKDASWLSSVKTVGEYAFAACTSLETVLLPPALDTVEAGTFSGCTALQTVSLSPSVTVIGERAFYGCSALASITLPEMTQVIMKEAFAECEALNAIIIPASVTTLGEAAFAGCSSIRELTVPTNVTEIGQNLINRCTSLETLTVPFMGSNRESGGKLTYLAEAMPTRLQYVRITNATILSDKAFADCSFVESIVLPHGLTTIGSKAFQNCSGLKSLTVPETVTEIGAAAFSGCNTLKEITIPNSVTRLKSGVLEGCTSLEKVTIPFIGQTANSSRTLSYLFSEQSGDSLPTSLTEITITNASSLASSAFEGCSQLTKITLDCNLKTVGDRAFANCASVSELTLPSTVEHLGDYAFEGCYQLRTLKVPASATYIGYNALYGCSGLEELEIPFVGSTPNDGFLLYNLFGGWVGNTPDSLKKITVTNSNFVKDYAFSGCSALTEIHYTCDVTTIGNYAFENCSSLTQFSVPDTVVSIGEYAFRSCTALQELTLPSTLERIETGAFEGCTNIRTLTIPTSVTYMGSNVLNNCHALEELKTPFVGTYRGSNARFYEMFGGWSGSIPSGLKKVTITDSSSVSDYAFYDCSNIREIICDCNVTSIGEYAFAYCYGLTDFTFPKTVEQIGDSAFYHCQNLEKFSLPSSLTQIGASAFEGSNQLRTLEIPDSVVYIGYNALHECHSLEELKTPFVGTSRDNDTRLMDIFDYYGYGNIPDSLKKVTVTDSSTVKPNAFEHCWNIEEIIYECDVTSIGSYAFYYCNSLATFTISDSVTSIGESAFYGCGNLEKLSIPNSVKSIGGSAFEGCSQISTLTIPTSVEYIGYNALYGCSGLQELTIPFVGTSRTSDTTMYALFDSYGYGNIPTDLKKITVTDSTSVPDSAFCYFYHVEEIVFTKDVVHIGASAFQHCNALKKVDLGDSFQSIGSHAFDNCYSLKHFTIPATCQSVGNYAFSGAFALYEVYNKSSIAFGNWDDYSELLNNCLVYRDGDDEVIRSTISGFEFLLADDGNWYVVGHNGEDETLSFPASPSVGNTAITSYRIARYAFYNRQNIRSVTLPAAVTHIENSAFTNCYGIREVYDLSPSLTVTRGSYDNGQVALNAYIVHTSADAEPLTTVTINDFEFVKSGNTWLLIGYHGNEGDITLGHLTYQGKDIPAYEVLRTAFQYNYNVTSLVITDAVKKLDSYAFENMGSLRTVTFREDSTLTVIPEYAFAWCYNLRQVTLPSTLTEIRYDAFWDCSSLREVYNPSSLSLTIGSNDHGSVAKYALIIHDSLSDPPLAEVTIGDYQFLNSGSVWMLEKYNGTEENITLGAFTYNGATVDAYSILPGAFQENAYIERVQIGNQVKSIGQNAFNYCPNLKSVSFESNTSITEIQPYTFASNPNLEQIVLPSSLETIGEGAFESCTNLLEIYNLSNLTLTIGSHLDGSVARYAKVIHTSMNEAGLGFANVVQNGYTYKFVCENGVWSMYARLQQNGSDWRYVLPELVIDGTVTPYQVTANLSGYNSVVIPASVSYVNWNKFSGYEIFYMGTEQAFATMTAGFYMDNYSVLYYADCIHEDNQWTYSDNGNIMTGTSFSYEILQESTCLTKLVTRFTCTRCQETWEHENEDFGNHSLEAHGGGYACLVCHKQFDAISLQDKWHISNDTVNPFVVTEFEEITSTNKADYSTATFTLTAKEDMVFMYRYSTSTEEGCDVLIIRKNGEEILRASGIMEEPAWAYEVTVSAGDEITIVYNKDGSIAGGKDLVMILDLVYFVEEAGDNNA